MFVNATIAVYVAGRRIASERRLMPSTTPDTPPPL